QPCLKYAPSSSVDLELSKYKSQQDLCLSPALNHRSLSSDLSRPYPLLFQAATSSTHRRRTANLSTPKPTKKVAFNFESCGIDNIVIRILILHANVTETMPLELRLKFGIGFRRVHITE
ncbi:hypothetical protein CCACVL1_14345, partial [Corchorus capsularis]